MSISTSPLATLRAEVDQLSDLIQSGTIKTRSELIQRLPANNSTKFRIFSLLSHNFPEEELFSEEIRATDVYNQICWQSYSKEDKTLNSQVYFIAEAKFLSDEGSLEDFRPLVLYLYRQGLLSPEKQESIIEALLLKILHTEHEPKLIIQLLLTGLDFMGLPINPPRDIATITQKMDLLDLTNLLSELDTVDVIFSRPTYLEEIVENLDWAHFKEESTGWLSQKVMARAFSAYFSQLLQEVKDQFDDTEKKPIEEAIPQIENFLTEKSLDLPISFSSVFRYLTELVSPTPITMDSIDQIPQEILSHMLPKYSYSTKKKNRLRSIHFIGGCGIGRSSILVSTDKANILMDWGLAVSNSQIPHWTPQLHGLDAVLISHAHLDHVGALPFLYSDLIGFDGPWFSLPLTKQFASILLSNNRMLLTKGVKKRVRKNHPSISECISSTNLARAFDNYIRLKLNNKKIEISPEVLLTVYPAGHIYGSAAFYLEVGDKTILYTGDLNLENSASLKGADIPRDADITIFDGTYWGRPPFNQENAEKTLVEAVTNHKRTIIPAFSLGRTQEILTLLERNSLTKDRLVSLIGMGARISKIVNLQGNYSVPRHFDINSFEEDSILIAGGGMLQGGLARELLDHTRDDSQTSVVLCGYQAPRTLGWALDNGLTKDIYKQTIYRARISAHTSSDALQTFIKEVKGKKIMVHTPFNEQDAIPKIPSVTIPRVGTSIQF